MGYESKLYVVQKYDTKDTESGKRYYADIIATFKLSKIGGYDLFKSYPATDCFIYADDGNTHITWDDYGDPLREIPIPDAIKIIEGEMKKELESGVTPYIRWQPCLSLLKSFNLAEWKNLVVLHYGY